MFSPDYVRLVLNDNFEDAKALLLAPLMADPLRPPRDAGRRSRSCLATTRGRSAPRSMPSTSMPCAVAQFDGTCEDLFFHVERLIADACGEDVGRPAAHRAQPQRHRHDDVPDAGSASRSSIVVDGAAGAAQRADRAGRPPSRRRCSPRTRTRSRRSRRRSPTTCWRSSSSSSATPAVCAPRTSQPIAIRSARARSPAPGFRSIASAPVALLGFDGPTGNTYGSIATVDYLLESVPPPR